MWIDLTGEIEEMFKELVRFAPDRSGTRFFRVEDGDASIARLNAWKRRNSVRVKAYDRARYIANRDRIKAQVRAYYATNRTAIRARRRLA